LTKSTLYNLMKKIMKISIKFMIQT